MQRAATELLQNYLYDDDSFDNEEESNSDDDCQLTRQTIKVVIRKCNRADDAKSEHGATRMDIISQEYAFSDIA